ncbi:MAG TPA: hypothetical protein P5546_05745 [Bacilli bacterium]|mgnify:FL=1|jgi:hypothetical protein|nr:hypothetical protein [Bacilli bacterium]
MSSRQLKKQLVFSILMVNFLLVAIFFTVFSWFTLQDQNTVGNFYVNIQSPNVIEASIETFAIGTVVKNGSEKTFFLALDDNNEPIPLDYLPTYDDREILLTEYKPYLALNLRFKITSENANVAISAATFKNFQSTAENFISNCTQFILVSYSDPTQPLTPLSEPISFVSIDGENVYKEKSIEIMHDSFSDQNISLWFILEYNKSAIEYIRSHFDGPIVEVITYENDIRLEITDL